MLEIGLTIWLVLKLLILIIHIQKEPKKAELIMQSAKGERHAELKRQRESNEADRQRKIQVINQLNNTI